MNVLHYLLSGGIIFSVTAPWIFVVYWYMVEGKRNPPPTAVVWQWMLCVLGSYYMSFWTVTDDFRALTGVNVFFIYLCIYLYLGNKITPSTAYALTFLDMWIVDFKRASELIVMGENTFSNFFEGIGGAGIFDALCIYPFLAAILVRYVRWRRQA